MARRKTQLLVHTVLLVQGFLMVLVLAGCGDQTGPGQPTVTPGQGMVRITALPDDPGFPWRLDRPDGLEISGVGDTTLVDMPTGFYALRWDSLDLWVPPDPDSRQGQLASGEYLRFRGTYIPASDYYPQVRGVEARHGQEPGQVTVHWLWYVSGEHPPEHYEVAVNLTGPVTQANWPASDTVRMLNHEQGQVGYTLLLDEEDGLIPGEEAWFGVRAVAADNWTTHTYDSPSLVVSRAWWAEGMVTDHAGQPVAQVTVGCDQVDEPVVTGPDGTYRLGPLLDQEEVVLWLDATAAPSRPGANGWYNFRSTPIVFAGNPNLDLMALPRFGTDPVCSLFGGDFLDFLRFMTKTDAPGFGRPNQMLCSWPQYPVKVFIPEYTRPDGVDFGAAARYGAAVWNLVLGETMLIWEGVTEDEAQVVFSFDDLGAGISGVTALAEPSGQDSPLGYVVPERINVGINNVVLPTTQRVQETSLHELGHALGLFRHVPSCSQVRYLMAITAAGVLDDGPENAVNPDEIRAMQAVWHLPRWMDLVGFH